MVVECLPAGPLAAPPFLALSSDLPLNLEALAWYHSSAPTGGSSSFSLDPLTSCWSPYGKTGCSLFIWAFLFVLTLFSSFLILNPSGRHRRSFGFTYTVLFSHTLKLCFHFLSFHPFLLKPLLLPLHLTTQVLNFFFFILHKKKKKKIKDTDKSKAATNKVHMQAVWAASSLLLRVWMLLVPGPSWRALPWGLGSPQRAAGWAGPLEAALVAAQCGCNPDGCPAPSAPCEDSQQHVRWPPGVPAGLEPPAEPPHSPPVEKYKRLLQTANCYINNKHPMLCKIHIF